MAAYRRAACTAWRSCAGSCSDSNNLRQPVVWQPRKSNRVRNGYAAIAAEAGSASTSKWRHCVSLIASSLPVRARLSNGAQFRLVPVWRLTVSDFRSKVYPPPASVPPNGGAVARPCRHSRPAHTLCPRWQQAQPRSATPVQCPVRELVLWVVRVSTPESFHVPTTARSPRRPAPRQSRAATGPSPRHRTSPRPRRGVCGPSRQRDASQRAPTACCNPAVTSPASPRRLRRGV